MPTFDISPTPRHAAMMICIRYRRRRSPRASAIAITPCQPSKRWLSAFSFAPTHHTHTAARQ